MKKFFIFLLITAVYSTATAQNFGFGTNDPQAKVHVAGNLLVTTPNTVASNIPTALQSKTMVNATTITFANTDSTGYIYDPGGPAGNYLANLLSYCSISLPSSSSVGIEITAESMQLGIGDSLIIKETASSTAYLLAVGNGYTTTGKWTFGCSSLHITFKSNTDVNVGTGFSLLFKTLYDNSALLPNFTSYTKKALFFDTKNSSFRSGLINNSPRGEISTAIGNYTTASGYASTAMGSNSIASGATSTAMGVQTIASGNNATAMGNNTTASNSYTIAMGYNTTASGHTSTAMGSSTTASGNTSTAMGYYSVASAEYSTAIGVQARATGVSSIAIGSGTTASGNNSIAMGRNSEASGNNSTAMDSATIASGNSSTAMGVWTVSRGYGGTAIGMYNNPILSSSQNAVTSTTPLFIIGNGNNYNSRSNALVVLKDGSIGVGTDNPATSLHIKHAGGGGLMLENVNNNNKWRLYSASGDNNLTFYNNSSTEVADIDDVSGSFNSISDEKLKKNIEAVPAILPLLMQLQPSHYHFNWQEAKDQKQLGLLAQKTNLLFPELVSYSKASDLYKINYAGFSVVAIKAIQEQQKVIEGLQQEVEKLKKTCLSNNGCQQPVIETLQKGYEEMKKELLLIKNKMDCVNY